MTPGMIFTYHIWGGGCEWHVLIFLMIFAPWVALCNSDGCSSGWGVPVISSYVPINGCYVTEGEGNSMVEKMKYFSSLFHIFSEHSTLENKFKISR